MSNLFFGGVARQGKSFFTWGIFLICIALLGAGLGIVWGLAALDNGLIAPGVFVQGIELGGQEPQVAVATLSQQLHEDNLGKALTLHWQERSWNLQPEQIEAQLNLRQAVKEAMLVGRDSNSLANFLRRYLTLGSQAKIPLEMTLERKKLAVFLQKISQEVNREPVNARILIHPDDTIEVVGEQAGQRLNYAQTEALIKEHLLSTKREIELPVEIWQPEVTAQVMQERGIKRLLSSISSTFSRAKVNRSYNIEVAARVLDGVMLAPGEVFSFNKALGPRSLKAGYRMAGVIVNNEVVEGIGGGICQVSSTLYNAALLANLEIVQRTNHSRPITYFPLGRDATVAYNYLDLKLKNNTGKHVLFRAQVRGNRLLVRIFGDKPEGETVSLVTNTTAVLPYPIKEVTDQTLPAGKTVLEKKGGSGFKVNVWRIVKLKGREIKRELISRDTYNPAPQVVRMGTGAVPEKAVERPVEHLEENSQVSLPENNPPVEVPEVPGEEENSNSPVF